MVPSSSTLAHTPASGTEHHYYELELETPPPPPSTPEGDYARLGEPHRPAAEHLYDSAPQGHYNRLGEQARHRPAENFYGGPSDPAGFALALHGHRRALTPPSPAARTKDTSYEEIDLHIYEEVGSLPKTKHKPLPPLPAEVKHKPLPPLPEIATRTPSAPLPANTEKPTPAPRTSPRTSPPLSPTAKAVPTAQTQALNQELAQLFKRRGLAPSSDA